MNVGLYNNSSALFANARKTYQERKIFLVIAEGHIIAGRDGIVARFADDRAAEACLAKAGYTRDPVTENNIWHP